MSLARVAATGALLLSVTGASALTGIIQRVSVSSSGEQANGKSEVGRISADGRYVVFASWATNLVSGDRNRHGDVFVHDRVRGTTELVSISTTGDPIYESDSWGCGISHDGRYVMFHSSGLGPWADHVMVRDRVAGTTELVSISSSGEWGNDASWGKAISPDGRYVAFSSFASNLVPGDTNGLGDVFVRDRTAGTTERVSVSTSGEQGNNCSQCASISADGRHVAFVSVATNLVAGDSNGYCDVFLRDRVVGTTELISVNETGESGNSESTFPEISPDGRCVLFTSWASDLMPGDTNDWWDVFLRDRLEGATELVSVSSSGEQGSRPDDEADFLFWGGISADGRYVVFHTDAAGIVPGDTNDRSEVFLRDRAAGTTELVSVSLGGDSALGRYASISGDGRCIEFESLAHDLVPADTNDRDDVFVHDLDARFHDVPRCFWAFASIEACVDSEIAMGYPKSVYRPKSPVTRGQMAVYIARTLCGGDASVPDPECTEAPHTDVDCDHWARKYIVYCADAGVVHGYDDGSYQPDRAVTRAQMAVFIGRAMAGGEDNVPDMECTEAPFPDVPCDFWARKHVEYILSEGVTQGYPDGRYHPDETVARDQMAVYITRGFNLPA